MYLDEESAKTGWLGLLLLAAARLVAVAYIASPMSVGSQETIQRLTVATWNTENLGGEHGVALFPGRSYERTLRDYDAFRKYLIDISPDLILLQELGSSKAMKQVLPQKYSFFISPEYLNQEPVSPGLFNGIAFDGTKLRVVGFVSIPTGISYSERDGSMAKARDTIGIQIQVGALQVWVLSAHLKSSCARKTLPDEGASVDCIVLRDQLRVLRDWLIKLTADGSKVILGGDFNRRGTPDYASDAYLSILDFPSTARMFVKPDQRNCPTFTGINKDPIDFFVLYGLQEFSASVREVTFAEADLRAGYKLSDHCPVVLEIAPVHSVVE
jgi:endonuclease/exonuclease/phosphatase family metal-dependent hydrolase